MKQTVLITGASTGIGYELAKLFSKEGCDLILIARHQDRLDAVAKELGGTVIVKDLAQMGAAQEIVDQIHSEGRHVDILVNNAGFGSLGAFAECDLSIELEMIQVNIVALTTLTRLCLPGMIARKSGGILNVASTAGFAAGPYMSVYYATKAYVISFSQAIAEELAGSGVTVTAMCPGPTRTGFQDRAGAKSSPLFNSKLIRVMSAQQVAKIGHKAFRSGKQMVVTGLTNKIAAFSTRLAPRRLSNKLAGRINRNKK